VQLFFVQTIALSSEDLPRSFAPFRTRPRHGLRSGARRAAVRLHRTQDRVIAAPMQSRAATARQRTPRRGT
jgi:hypothetical protein